MHLNNQYLLTFDGGNDGGKKKGRVDRFHVATELPNTKFLTPSAGFLPPRRSCRSKVKKKRQTEGRTRRRAPLLCEPCVIPVNVLFRFHFHFPDTLDSVWARRTSISQYWQTACVHFSGQLLYLVRGPLQFLAGYSPSPCFQPGLVRIDSSGHFPGHVWGLWQMSGNPTNQELNN